jgi:membrane protease YdiL (CAAX protease family)
MSEESQETRKNSRAAPKPDGKGGARRFLKGLLGFSWPIIAFFAASFVVAIAVLVLSFLTGQPLAELVETNHGVRLAYQAVLMVGVLLLITVPFFRIFFKEGTKWQEVLGLTKNPHINDLGLALVMYAGYLTSTVVAFVIVSQFIPGINLEQAQELGITAPESLLQYILIFAALAIIPPIFEELIFRGFVFKALREQYSFWISAVLTSLAFAIVHMQVNIGIDVFILSLFLCYLRERTGSLWAPILLHTLKNGLAFLLLFVFNVR